MILVKKRRGVKVRFDGPDSKGKNTTRSLLVADATVDEVRDICRAAIERYSENKQGGRKWRSKT